MDEYLRLAIGITGVVLFVVLLKNGMPGDDEARGNALSFNSWRRLNYKEVNGKQYRIHPPNSFETKRQIRRSYRRYCYRKNSK